MAHVRKRGSSYTITASLGYKEDGSQIRKFTTFTPPPGVTPGKVDKLSREFAVKWEEGIRGYVSLDENKTLFDGVKREEFWQQAGMNRESMHIVNLLRRHKEIQGTYLKSLGEVSRYNGSAFTNLHGDYVNQVNLNAQFKRPIFPMTI